MKRVSNPVLPSDFDKKKAHTQVEEMPPKQCMVCNKATQGYGQFALGVVCSRKCNDTYMANKPSLIDYVIGENHENPDSVSAGGIAGNLGGCEG